MTKKPYYITTPIIMQFIENSSVTVENISDTNILVLLGRDTPLPDLVALAGTPAWVYWTVGGGVGALILVLTLIYVAYVRRQKKKRLADMPEILGCRSMHRHHGLQACLLPASQACMSWLQ